MPAPNGSYGADGLNATQVSLSELQAVIQSHVDLLTKAVFREMAENSSSAADPRVLTTGLGEYLILMSKSWAELTARIRDSPSIHDAALKVHKESLERSRLCDLSGVVSLENEFDKLTAISALTRDYAAAVQKITGVEAPLSPPGHQPNKGSHPLFGEIDEVVRKHLQIQ